MHRHSESSQYFHKKLNILLNSMILDSSILLKENMLTAISVLLKKTIILGDFNANYLS